MRRKLLHNVFLLLLISAFFSELWITKLVLESRRTRLSEYTVLSQGFRSQKIGEEMLTYIRDKESPGTEVALYLLESKFGVQDFPYMLSEKQFISLKKSWKKETGWTEYHSYVKVLWDDVKCFPVSESSLDSSLKVNYVDSWMYERTYGGKRGHEGTDIMASKNIAGIYPIVSMTDGIVRSKGWLEKGGYRIGIESPSGAYFYYAHLHSYASIEIGDEIRAGELLGFMGDSGYGDEGTTGKFPVHLHLGIYIYPKEKELSINPYWILRYSEKRTIKSSYSSGDIK